MRDYSGIREAGRRREYNSLEREADREREYYSQLREFVYKNCRPCDIHPLFWDILYEKSIINDSFQEAKSKAIELADLLNLDVNVSIMDFGDKCSFFVRVPKLTTLDKIFLIDIINYRINLDGNYPSNDDIPNLSYGAKRHLEENNLLNKKTCRKRYSFEGETFMSIVAKYKKALPKRYFDFLN